jgi:predicted transglutaminase-like cysteine proteinase
MDWLLVLGATLLLSMPALAVEAIKARPKHMAMKSLDLPDDGPRFFTLRQLLAKQRGESIPDSTSMLLPVAAGDSAGVSAETQRAQAPFAARGFAMFASMNETIAGRWQSIQDEWRRESRILAICEQGGECSRAAGIMASIKRQAARTEGLEQLTLVNARVNAAVHYMSDFARYGTADHWSTPLETLGQSGDCEDYVIAKFYILRGLGLAEDDLRIVLVRDRRAREDHAVLAVRAATGWLLLDNRTNAIESDQSMPHYRPMIALNSARMEMFAAPYAELDDLDVRGAILPASEAVDASNPPKLRGALN